MIPFTNNVYICIMYSDYKLIIHEQRAHNLFIFELQW